MYIVVFDHTITGNPQFNLFNLIDCSIIFFVYLLNRTTGKPYIYTTIDCPLGTVCGALIHGVRLCEIPLWTFWVFVYEYECIFRFNMWLLNYNQRTTPIRSRNSHHITYQTSRVSANHSAMEYRLVGGGGVVCLDANIRVASHPRTNNLTHSKKKKSRCEWE